MNLSFLRKLSSGIAFVGAFLFLFPIGFISNNYTWIVIFFVSISMGFLGCNKSGFLTSLIEIAPQYSSIIMGITNSIASCVGFVTTLICGAFSKKYVIYSKIHIKFI